jgi:23S rRNA (cytidine1920-2'-O)/16S rRNA (cytidine1409-2'-O)-methyltransferase
MPKTRLDIQLVEKGLAESRALAQRLIMAGQVRVDDQVVLKPATKFENSVNITVDLGPRYVSRGGEKLAAALDHFQINLQGKICADVGASTGGFTDCMLQAGAQKVYAIDVGRGILDWRLRQDERVVVFENTNARYLVSVDEPVNFVTVDVSFISLKIMLPVICGWFRSPGGEAVVLIKPQFEAGRKEVQRGKGVIRSPEVHARVIRSVLEAAQDSGYEINGVIRSPLTGPKGNQEFLAWIRYPRKEPAVELDNILMELFGTGELSETE